MNLYINVLKDASEAGQTHYGGMPFDETTIIIRQDGVEIFNDIMEKLMTLPLPYITLLDNHGFEVRAIPSTQYYNPGTKTGTLALKIPLRRMTDSCTFEIKLEHPDYHTYSNVITVYGYDVGNMINIGNTGYGDFPVTPGIPSTTEQDNVFNPVTTIDTLTDALAYGYSNDLIIRHNPDFNIGMIPRYINGGAILNDLRYGVSSRFIAIINPNTKELRVINANSNYSGTPAYNLAYGVKLPTDPTYSISTFPEMTINVTDDIQIGMFFSIDADPLALQRRVLSKHVSIIPDTVKNINNIPLDDYVGIIGGSFNLNVLVDASSVFYFWSNKANGLAGASNILIDYLIEKETSPGTFAFVERTSKMHSFLSTDSLQGSSVYEYYSVSGNSADFTLSLTDVIRITTRVMIGTGETASDLKTTGDTLQVGHKYMIAFLGYTHAEDFTPIGAVTNTPFMTFVANANAPTFNFMDKGVLYEVVTTAPIIDVYAPIFSTPLYYNINHDTYDYSLPYGHNESGYLRKAMLDASEAQLIAPYDTLYSVVGTDCSTFEIFIYPNDPPTHISMTASKYDADADMFVSVPNFNIDIYGNTSSTITESFSLPDGIYRININHHLVYFFSMCNIMECKIGLIKAAVCGCCSSDDCKAKAYYKLNEFNVLWNTYMSMISASLDTFQFTADTIVPFSTIINYIEIDKIMRRLGNICNDCKDFINKCKTC